MILKGVLKQYNTGTCILYRVNGIGADIVILYVHDLLAIIYKPSLMNTIEYTKE